MAAISYHGTVNDLQGLDWVADGPFARLEWFRLLEQRGIKPLFATARQGSQGLCLPLAYGDGRLDVLANWYAFTWTGLRTGGADEEALLPELARDLARRTQRIDFARLPGECGTADRLARGFRKAGWFVARSPCDINHILPVAGRSFGQYLAARPGQLRTTLKRKAKKVEVRLATTFVPADWAAYEEIYAESWKPEEGDPPLLRRFAEQESAAGRYRFGMACADGRPIAAQFWTVDGTTAYIHKLAHRESARALSPGTTLTAALLEQVIDCDRVALVDFGTGDDPYKRDWMEQQRTRWHLTCLRPAAPRNWPAIARAAARNLVSRASTV